jgi:exopolysaccharide biosynthesis polyprenyl glycosylphosphotransferase
LGGNVTDLIDRPTPGGTTPGLHSERIRNIVESGQAWPLVERRRSPRRRDDSAGVDDRRVAIPTQPVPSPSHALVPTGEAHRRDRHVRGYRHAVLAIDLFAAAIGAVVAQLVRFGTTYTAHSSMYWLGVLIMPLVWTAGVGSSRAYESRFLANSAEEYRRVINATFGLIAVVAVISYVSNTELARGYVILALSISAVLALGGRYIARRKVRHSRRQGLLLQDVLVVGHEWAVLDLVTELRLTPDSGLRVIGACMPGGRGSRQMAAAGIPVVGDLDQVVEAVKTLRADVLAVTTCVEFGGAELRQVCWALENTDVEIVVAPALIEVAGPRLHIRPVARLPLLHVEKPEFTGGRRFVKGAFDRVMAALALFFLSPLLLAVAIAVRVNSRGPAFFRQTRIGVRGEPFTILKFRSMFSDAEGKKRELEHLNENADGLLFKMRNDPRVTSVGRLLRRFSVDELPQLINVVKGEMSLVGPRPPLPSEVEQYAHDVRRRLLVKPGLTGLWQVSGRSGLSWQESVRLDLRYVENWSLVWDFEILWKTAYAVFRGSGAY